MSKELSPDLREQYRLSVLGYLARVAGRALTESVLAQFLRSEWGNSVDRDTVTQLVAYLSGKGFIEEAPKHISPEVRAWWITATGSDEHARLTGE